MTVGRFFHLEPPAVISFSGGRTSAFMLHRILEEEHGELPAGVHVVFENTGKERPETLDFIREVSQRWGVRVRWVEWRYDEDPQARFREVTYETASRNGEPFWQLIEWKQFLPNPMMRICTQHLKVQAARLFRLHELQITEDFENAIGIRYDEPRRWRIVGQDKRDEREWKVAPLVTAKVTKREVMEFWARQPFDLQLETWEGNCDLCFLKGRGKLERVMYDRPDLADWWIAQEARPLTSKGETGARFRADRPAYATMLANVQAQPPLPGTLMDEDTDGSIIDCLCTEE